MRTKQSILEDYSEMDIISIKDLTRPEQKYIHFWDFMDLDDVVYEFSARMIIAARNLKDDIGQRYRDYYTRTMVQSPDRFIRHNRELQEIEYMLENPFFLALVHFALTNDMDEGELRYWTLASKKRIMENRRGIKDTIEREIAQSNRYLVR